MDFPVFSKNGIILPIGEANVPLGSIEYAYGFGVYETIRVKNGRPVFLADHIDRLVQSAKIIRLEHDFGPENVQKYICDFIAEIKEGTYNLKILLIGAEKRQDATLYILASNPLFPDKKLYQDGVKVITHNYERLYPQAKTLNMLQSYLSYREAKRNDAYDALLVNREGNITEGTRTNFFAIQGNIIYSPFEKDILPGVMRKNMLACATQHGYTIEEKNIPLASLAEYEGAFLTSTSTKILPIKKVDEFEFKEIPKSFSNLMGIFDKFLGS